MVDGWNFNDDMATHELVDENRKYKTIEWPDMSFKLLSELLVRLIDGGDWPDQVENIREELKSRVPPKTLASVTVKGKL